MTTTELAAALADIARRCGWDIALIADEDDNVIGAIVGVPEWVSANTEEGDSVWTTAPTGDSH